MVGGQTEETCVYKRQSNYMHLKSDLHLSVLIKKRGSANHTIKILLFYYKYVGKYIHSIAIKSSINDRITSGAFVGLRFV